MATLDTRPQTVDLLVLAGDTLSVQITAPASITDGMQWDAQVKLTRGSDIPDATFAITPPAMSGGPASLVLESEVTAGLVAGVTAPKYVGVWDCQISAAGDDPVRTLVQGKITIDQDVTRLVV